MKNLIAAILLFTSFALSGQHKTVYHCLEGSYIALNVVDLSTTFKIIHNGGYELNPIMRGTPAHMIAVKSIATFGVLGLNRMIAKENPKAGLITLIALNIGMGYVVAHNYQVYIRLKI